jgi:hypothetical protein
MGSKRLGSSAVVLLIFSFAIWRQGGRRAAALADPVPQPAAVAGLSAVTLVFGGHDVQPSNWDGSASISAGSIERIVGYHFTDACKVDGNVWTCSTHLWTPTQQGMNPREKPQPHATPVEPVGVTIYFRAPAEAAITVKLSRGREFFFRPANLPEIDGIFPLDATIDLHRSPVVQQITEGSSDSDFATIAAGGGTVWVAWQSYRDKADTVYLRGYRQGQWGERLTVTDRPCDLFMTGVAAAAGKATVVWSEHAGGSFHLRARTYDGKAFGAIEDVTSGEGNSLFHQVAADAAGNLHVAYQSWRKGHSSIYLRSKVGGRWGKEIEISDPGRPARANDWDAAVAVDHSGTPWVAWDSYASGSFNVLLRPVRGGTAGPILKVTDSTRYHAHPSVAVDEGDRVWVAYEEAPENWGKDVGFLFESGSGLYDGRTVKVAVYAGGRWMTPVRQPAEAAPPVVRDFVQQPKLVAGNGRMWLVVRPMTSSRLPTTHWKAGGKWEVCATYYAGDRWSPLIVVPDSVGRNGGEMGAAADGQGNAVVALVTDHKRWGGPNFGTDPGANDVIFTALSSDTAAAPQLAARPAEQPGGLPSEPAEREDIARLRDYRIEAEGRSYRIYRGDLHRHTEISLDGAGDGTLYDAYRYAMDAAGLDFLVVTDHQSGQNNYMWWRTQKAADMFHVPGFFTAVYGTERSVNYPNGHRNLLFAQRGVPILDIGADERQGKVNSGPVLYPFLKKYGGIATPHSSHTGMGTDWRDNDPEVDPIVEIWEGSRTSAEHEGAPMAPAADRSEMWAGGYRPLGFVWNAWAKGYKIGVQASSDHASTHLSYTCVIAENSTREGLIDAMRKRHTYAATRNMLLDYRVRAEGRTWLQGDELKTSSLPEVWARIRGTGPLKQVVVVRDNRYVYSHEPEGSEYELSFREPSLAAGEHYYYVRVEQRDGNMAWSSPVWVNYTGDARR